VRSRSLMRCMGELRAAVRGCVVLSQDRIIRQHPIRPSGTFPTPMAQGRVGLSDTNISGNNYRLIAAIHYNRRKIYIRNVLTHAEYDLGIWKLS
jgi:HigB_toxin, RelE-like toxic component of a toxin-antitoxin system